MIREISVAEKDAYNQTVAHIIQAWEWGEFREKTGVRVIRLGRWANHSLIQGMQATFHPVPKTKLSVGYIPKSTMIDRDWLRAWTEVGKRQNAVYLKFEPNILAEDGLDVIENLSKSPEFKLRPAKKPLFTKYNFLLDLTKTEEELLARMKPKTRYNIRLAQRKGVTVEPRSDPEAFATYLRLYFETTKRQGFFGHDPAYHRRLWETLQPKGLAYLLVASWQQETLVTWMLFHLNRTLYYAYGGSATQHRELMASNLAGWETIRFGQKLGCATFDLWGAARVPDPEPKDPYYGFHRFKAGYGGQLVEYLGSYDLILDPVKYELINAIDWLRWTWLNLKSRLS